MVHRSNWIFNTISEGGTPTSTCLRIWLVASFKIFRACLQLPLDSVFMKFQGEKWSWSISDCDCLYKVLLYPMDCPSFPDLYPSCKGATTLQKLGAEPDEARIEDAKRLRIEGEARIEGEKEQHRAPPQKTFGISNLKSFNLVYSWRGNLEIIDFSREYRKKDF